MDWFWYRRRTRNGNNEVEVQREDTALQMLEIGQVIGRLESVTTRLERAAQRLDRIELGENPNVRGREPKKQSDVNEYGGS